MTSTGRPSNLRHAGLGDCVLKHPKALLQLLKIGHTDVPGAASHDSLASCKEPRTRFTIVHRENYVLEGPQQPQADRGIVVA